MAKSQGDRFSTEQQQVALLAKALSHPARIAVLEILAHRDVCVCGDIVLELPLSQATVSQHLKVLKEAGLISGTIEGPKSCYCINWTQLGAAKKRLSDWFSRTELHKSTCC